MLFSYSEQAADKTDSTTDFKSNYRHLKKIINEALREGTPLEELHLIPKNPAESRSKKLSREDLVKLLHTIRRIRPSTTAVVS